MKKVKCLVIAGYMMILLGSISSVSFLTSSAKYTKEDLHALNYGVKFKDLSSSYTRSKILKTSDAYTLQYGLSFKRKNNMEKEDTLETFRIELDNPYCKVESASINQVLTTITNHKLSFSNLGEDQVDMTIYCDFQSMVDQNKLKLTMNTYGSFNGEDDFNYLFATDSFQITNVDDYYQEYGYPNKDSCVAGNKTCRLLKTNEEADMYSRLVSWLGSTTKIDDAKKDFISNYLKSSSLSSNFENKVNEENITYFNTLDGLKAWMNDQYYIFEVDDFFGSYAVTDSIYRLRTNSTSPIALYFYSDDLVDDLFVKYAKKYLSNVDMAVMNKYLKEKEEAYQAENILELVKKDPRLKMTTYDETEKSLTIPTNLYSIMAGEKLKFELPKASSSNNRIRSLRRYLNSYVDPAWTELILYQGGTPTYFTDCVAKNDSIFDHYTYTVYEGEGLLLHIYAREDNPTQITFEEQYLSSNLLNLIYDFSSNTANTNTSIKKDLNAISMNVKGVALVLTDSSGNVMNNEDNHLDDGEYQSNIGIIKITTQNNQKQVEITRNS